MDGTSRANSRQYDYILTETDTESSSSDEDSFDDVNLEKSWGSKEGKVAASDSKGRQIQSLVSHSSTSPSVISRKKHQQDKHASTRVPVPGQHDRIRPVLLASSPPRFPLSPDQRRDRLQKTNAFMEAARTGKVPELEKLLDSGVDVDTADFDGMTALHHAARNGQLETMALLIRRFASRTAKSDLGYTPLALAASCGQGAVVEYLNHLGFTSPLPGRSLDGLDRKAAPERATVKPMKHAAASVTLDTFREMAVEYRERGEAENSAALVHAVKSNDLPGTARMLAALAKTYNSGACIPGCAHLEETDENAKTLLATACRNGRVELAMLLICAGAEVNSTDASGNTPLMHAVTAKQASIVSALLKAGARWSATNRYGNSALAMAIDNSDEAVLQALVDGRVDIWNATVHGESLIVYAANNGKHSIVKALLRVRADPPDKDGSRALARCARLGNKKAVESLLKAGADPAHQAADGHTAFTLAAANGREDVLALFLKQQPNVESKRRFQAQADSEGRTALILATLNGQLGTVRYLLHNQADPHKRDHAGRTALLWAASHGDSKMLKALFEFGATPGCADDCGNTIFAMAAEYDNQEVLEVISEMPGKDSSFNVNTPNKDGDTALIKAARRGHADTVELLLRIGADLLHANQAGRTAIHEAAQAGHIGVAKILQEALDRMPPVFPFANGLLQILSHVPLISTGLPDRVPVRPNEFDASGNSLMLLAAQNGQSEFLEEMLKSNVDLISDGADVSAHIDAPDFGFTMVESYASPSMQRVRPRMNLEERNLNGMTGLCLATKEGHYATVKLLIENGASVSGVSIINKSAAKGYVTPLWLAARLSRCSQPHGSPPSSNQSTYTPHMLVGLLLNNGATSDINTPCWQNQTPLTAAAGAGSSDVVELLISHGARVDWSDFASLTPLMHAAWYGHKDIVEILLNYGAAPETQEGEHSALVLAAESGHVEVIRLLAQRGAGMDRVDASGTSALICAVKHGHAAAVKALIDLGANIDQTDKNGKSALYYARKERQQDIIDLLAIGPAEPRDK